jgi:hypothetical protein
MVMPITSLYISNEFSFIYLSTPENLRSFLVVSKWNKKKTGYKLNEVNWRNILICKWDNWLSYNVCLC